MKKSNIIPVAFSSIMVFCASIAAAEYRVFNPQSSITDYGGRVGIIFDAKNIYNDPSAILPTSLGSVAVKVLDISKDSCAVGMMDSEDLLISADSYVFRAPEDFASIIKSKASGDTVIIEYLDASAGFAHKIFSCILGGTKQTFGFGDGVETAKRFTVPFNCPDGTKRSEHFIIYDSWKTEQELYAAIADTERTSSCKMPADVVTSFTKLMNIARENDVSYVALSVYALAKGNKEIAKKPEPPEKTASDVFREKINELENEKRALQAKWDRAGELLEACEALQEQQAYGKAFRVCEHAAKIGKETPNINSNDAEFNLYIMLYHGRISRGDRFADRSEAIERLKRAAEFNPSTGAMTTLAEMYESGNKWVSKNVPSAIKLYKSAAIRGGLVAQFEYSKRLITGNGVPQDIKLALRYLNRIVDNGGTYAEKAALYLSELYGHHNGIVYVDYDAQKSRDYLLKARKYGSSVAKIRVLP